MAQLKQNTTNLAELIDIANSLPDRESGGTGDTTIEDGLITRNISGSYTNPRVTVLGYDAFRYCSKLTSVHFPILTEISTRAFSNCSRLQTVDMPLLTSMGDQPFYSCGSLKNVNMPSLRGVGYRAFYGCSSLVEVEFPSLTAITSTQAFYGCSALEKLILPNSVVVTLANTNAFSGTKIAGGTGYVYVKNDLVESFKAATNWTTYANQIRSIDDLE